MLYREPPKRLGYSFSRYRSEYRKGLSLPVSDIDVQNSVTGAQFAGYNVARLTFEPNHCDFTK